MKILKSLVIVIAMAALVAGATSAYFTDQDKITNNTFAAGNLDLTVSPQTLAINVQNAESSYWYNSAHITAFNQSTIVNPIKWKISDEFVSETDSGFYNYIEASVWVQGLGYDQNTKVAPDGSNIDAQNVWNGDLKDLDFQFVNMPQGWSASVWVFTHLKTSAGNQYQGDGAQFNLVFDSTQGNNPGWSE